VFIRELEHSTSAPTPHGPAVKFLAQDVYLRLVAKFDRLKSSGRQLSGAQ